MAGQQLLSHPAACRRQCQAATAARTRFARTLRPVVRAFRDAVCSIQQELLAPGPADMCWLMACQQARGDGWYFSTH